MHVLTDASFTFKIFKLVFQLGLHTFSIYIYIYNEVVKDEDGQDIEDAVATLIYSISKHFIGDPAKIKDKTADLLTNLKCPKLHDFRWYKELFHIYIYIFCKMS